jgi:hypothetical protein
MGTVIQGKPRGLQEVVAHKMWWTGAEVHVVDTIEGVDALAEWLAVRRQPDGRRGPGRRCGQGLPMSGVQRSASRPILCMLYDSATMIVIRDYRRMAWPF